MDAELTRAVVSGVSFSVLTWILLLAGSLALTFLGAYLADKAKNVATRQDIAHITAKVEEVRAAFAAQLEEGAQRNRLRLAALEKRLEAHQKAYSLWRKLFHAMYSDQLPTVVVECQDWWENNCLYLTDDVRDAFVGAYFAAHNHQGLLQSGAETAEVRANFAQVESCGKVIVKSAGLPGFGKHEGQEIASRSKAGGS